MQGFARMSKLTNIRGRADYISNPARQEHIVIQSAAVDWQPYHDYEQANRKSAKANNEGREIILALPNEWAALPHEDLSAMVAHLAQAAVGKSTDLQWAVHWNKEHTNLHAHIIFSERTRTATGVYDRDVYLTDDGKVPRRKADRARDKDGNI
ncbi:MAG: MobA/MobL family protein, partial [Oscillospiraceae bacterium]|nr:MobA/MobL family protein [Oscillospiraceae bacterium]